MKSAKKSTSSSSASLKQGTLGFTSVKRTASNTQVKANKHLKSSEQEQIIQSVSSPETDDPIESSSSESEPHEVVREKKPIPKRRDTSRRQGVSRLRDGAEGDLGNLDLKNIPEKWRKHYGVVREKMGHLEPVHSQGQTLIHHILRVFDLSYEYGPCVGVTRLERWDRASTLGLNPPIEVREILMTNQGRDRHSQCVFHDEV